MSEPGHNGANELTDGERKSLFFHHFRKIAEKKVALEQVREEYKTLRKEARADGIVLGDMDFALRCAEVEDAGIVPEEIRRRAEIAAWFALPVDYQPDMFGDTKPAMERIEGEGHAAGLAGRNHDDHGYAGGSEEAEVFERGWQAGQNELLENLKSAMNKKNAEADGDGSRLVGCDEIDDDGEDGDSGDEDPFAEPEDDDDDRDLRPPFLQNAHADPVG